MNIIVTGGAGFIGSHLVEALVKDDHSVVVVDDLSSGRMENLPNDCVLHQANIVEGFKRLAEFWQADAIFHLAAQTSIGRSIDWPHADARVNILGTLNVIEAAKATSARVIMASTSAVYARSVTILPYQEGDRVEPTVPYGVSKAAAEMYLRNSGVDAFILRYGNVYGPKQRPVGESALVPRALDHIIRGIPFQINGDGRATRDYVYVSDVVSSNLFALGADKSQAGTYNVGWGKETSTLEMLRKIENLTGIRPKWEHRPAIEQEAKRVALDGAHAGSVLGFYPTVNLDDGLAETLKWYRGTL